MRRKLEEQRSKVLNFTSKEKNIKTIFKTVIYLWIEDLTKIAAISRIKPSSSYFLKNKRITKSKKIRQIHLLFNRYCEEIPYFQKLTGVFLICIIEWLTELFLWKSFVCLSRVFKIDNVLCQILERKTFEIKDLLKDAF